MVGGGDGSADEWPHPEDPLQFHDHTGDVRYLKFSTDLNFLLIVLARSYWSMWNKLACTSGIH